MSEKRSKILWIIFVGVSLLTNFPDCSDEILMGSSYFSLIYATEYCLHFISFN